MGTNLATCTLSTAGMQCDESLIGHNQHTHTDTHMQDRLRTDFIEVDDGKHHGKGSASAAAAAAAEQLHTCQSENRSEDRLRTLLYQESNK